MEGKAEGDWVSANPLANAWLGKMTMFMDEFSGASDCRSDGKGEGGVQAVLVIVLFGGTLEMREECKQRPIDREGGERRSKK